MNRWCLFAGLLVGLLGVSDVTLGHTVFRKEMQKKYSKTRVACEACHPKGEPRTERNEFGELFYQKLKEHDLSSQWEAFGEDRTGKSNFEKETMLPLFVKALDEIKVMESKDGPTYDELLKNAKLSGTKVKKPGAKSKDDEDDDDDDEEGGDDKDKGGKDKNLATAMRSKSDDPWQLA